MTTEELAPLPITKFEIHAVYGAHFNVDPKEGSPWQKWFETLRRSKTPPIRASWTPIYRGHSSMVTFELPHAEVAPRTLDVRHPSQWAKTGSGKNRPFNMALSRTLTVRGDGMAAMTMRLKANGTKIRNKIRS